MACRVTGFNRRQLIHWFLLKMDQFLREDPSFASEWEFYKWDQDEGNEALHPLTPEQEARLLKHLNFREILPYQKDS
jgi:hypothetical protein